MNGVLRELAVVARRVVMGVPVLVAGGALSSLAAGLMIALVLALLGGVVMVAGLVPVLRAVVVTVVMVMVAGALWSRGVLSRIALGVLSTLDSCRLVPGVVLVGAEVGVGVNPSDTSRVAVQVGAIAPETAGETTEGDEQSDRAEGAHHNHPTPTRSAWMSRPWSRDSPNSDQAAW